MKSIEKDVLIVSRAEGICTMTINRPERRNALTSVVFSRLIETMQSTSDDRETRVVVLRGAGEQAFSSGYEISRLGSTSGSENKDPLEEVILAVENCAVPVIAMIYGYCIAAGCALATACDLRIAAANARIGVTAARLGVVYPPSAMLRLINLVGVARAREILYTGELIEAGRAAEIGLINQIVPAERLKVVTYEMARAIADNSPISVRGTKNLILKIMKYKALSLETIEEFRVLQQLTNNSEDLKEGQRAFAEKRKPRFKIK